MISASGRPCLAIRPAAPLQTKNIHVLEDTAWGIEWSERKSVTQIRVSLKVRGIQTGEAEKQDKLGGVSDCKNGKVNWEMLYSDRVSSDIAAIQ